VPVAAVAMAIAGLLIECLFDFCGDGICVLHDGIGEKTGIHGSGQFSLRSVRVERGHSLIGRGLWRIRIPGRLRSGLLRNERQPKGKAYKRNNAQESRDSISTHTRPRFSLHRSVTILRPSNAGR
jgi:hypothetical protein